MSLAKTDLSATTAKLRPRRTLNRLALALVGVAAGALGQYLFRQSSLWDGLLFYGIGLILFTRALAKHQLNFNFSSPPTDSLAPTEWRSKAGLWLIFLILGSSMLAYRSFSNPELYPLAWGLYLIQIGMFIGSIIIFTQPWQTSSKNLLPHKYILWILIFIIGLALTTRLYNFESQPFGIWYDEAVAGLQARQILHLPDYRPILYAPINISGHLLFLYATALQWFGDNILSMRLVSVAFGVGTVFLAYLFGREARSDRFGLLLAFLVAVARWHINFSRIAMTGIDTPFFEFLSLFFLVRFLRRKQFSDIAWAGLSIGMGVMFYTAFRLYLIALFGFIALVLLIWNRDLVKWHQQLKITHKGWLHFSYIALFVIAIWLTTFPLIKFARDNPEAFSYRTRQVSIFFRRDQADIVQALWTTSKKHLLMFNFAGDNNGRHNLPGEPMLDSLMGIFFVLGVGLAVARFRRPLNLFFLILLPAALAGGIFSIDFEAPQSLRTIASIPAVIYFCGLAIAALGREAETALEPLSKAWTWIPAAALALFAIYTNAYTYFVLQGEDFASWNAFSTPETIAGQKMAELGPDHVYYLSPFLHDHPTLHFLAPEIKDEDKRPFSLPDVLPIRRVPDRPVALFIHPDDRWIFEEAQRLYPQADFGLARAPRGDRSDINAANEDNRSSINPELANPAPSPEGKGPPIIYFVNLQPADIASIQGLDLKYKQIPEEVPTGAPISPVVESRRAMIIQESWSEEQDFSTAEWKGILYAPRYGPYMLRLVSPDSARLEIDGFSILEGEGEQSESVVLAKGNHTIFLQADVTSGEIALYWQPVGQAEQLIPQEYFYSLPVTNHGLKGSYYPNDQWQGQPLLERIDPFLDIYFHLTPLKRPYSVEWNGWLDIPQTGLYTLGLRAVTEAELFLDDQLIISTSAPNQHSSSSNMLEAGLHPIQIRFRDTMDRSRIHLTWMTPTGQNGPIPTQYLWPPLGREPERVVPAPTPQTQPITFNWVRTFGEKGAAPSYFNEPRDIAVLENGHLVVADTGNKRVQILNSQGDFLNMITGQEIEPFEEPLAVVVNSQNEILILDSTLQWIYRYDAEGNFINRFGGPPAHLFHPRGMSLQNNEMVIVANTGGARLVFFNPDGSLAGGIGQFGEGPGQLNEPTDVARDQEGTYFVTEAENERIQRLDSGGTSLRQWTIPATYAFNGPHLALLPDGSLLMTESQSRSLYHYTPEGTALNQWSSIEPIQFAAPLGIYFDPDTQLLYVTDIQTHQIHIFELQQEPSTN